MSLILFGAGWDLGIIKKKYKGHNITDYIFVDALPNLPHYEKGMNGYEKSKNLKNFIGAIKDDVKTYGTIIEDSYNEDKNLLEMKVKVNRRKEIVHIKYFVNTQVTDFLHKKYKKLRDSVLYLAKEGFEPICSGLRVLRDLPNMRYEILDRELFDRHYWFDE